MESLMKTLVLDGKPLTLDEIEAVAVQNCPVAIAPDALDRVAASRELIEQILAAGETVYGVNTGFGKLSDVRIPRESLAELQTNLVRSHAGGVGAPLSVGEARAMLLLRANVLAKGMSGCRAAVPELLAALLNAGVSPVIPEKGSVGASGDLAPLAHLALVVIGEGEAFYKSERLVGAEALRRAGLRPLTLAAKEGLALLNGTQAMTAVGALAVARCRTPWRSLAPEIHGAGFIGADLSQEPDAWAPGRLGSRARRRSFWRAWRSPGCPRPPSLAASSSSLPLSPGRRLPPHLARAGPTGESWPCAAACASSR